MGIIKQGILGGFKNKVGGVVGSSWKGIATMRALPLSVSNPKTAAQVSNRSRFSAVAKFASIILSAIIKPLMDRFAERESGYNLFCRLNKDVWTDVDAPEWGDLMISKGRLLPPASVTIPRTLDSISVTSATGDRYALPTDIIYLLIVNKTDGEVLYQGSTGITRQTGGGVITPISSLPVGDDAQWYVSYLRADGSEVSDSASGQVGA